MNRLLDDDADALVSLARDMAKSGQTNPAELPIAIKHGGKYLVLEGNRRFAALKLLKDPKLADKDEHVKSFRRAAALGTPPKTVFTLVTETREEAEHWIFLRHTGENLGVGVKRWSAQQTATHRRRANKSIDSGTLRSIVIADDLEEVYAADEEIIELVRQIRRGKLTNIGRFFSPDVLAALHFAIAPDDGSSLRPRTLLVHHSAQQLRDFFAWALAYILEYSVDAYKNLAVRQGVLRSAAHLIPDTADATPEPFRLVDTPPTPVRGSRPEETVESEGRTEKAEGRTGSPTANGISGAFSQGSSTSEEATPEPTSGDSGRGWKKPEAKPEKYLLQGLKLPNHPERIQRLLKECRSLSLEEFPGVACVMVRVIVELSVSSPPALVLSGASEGSPLKDKIIEMLRYLDPHIERARGRDGELAQAYMEASELGVQYLNGFVHNSNISPDHHLARRFSKAFRPLLVRVDAAL